jgi:hypothetical protein
VLPQQGQDGEIGAGSAVGHTIGGQIGEGLAAQAALKLRDELRLAQARLAHHPHHLATALPGLPQERVQQGQLAPPDEWVPRAALP